MEEDRDADAPGPMKRVRMTLDGAPADAVFPAWTDGTRWNGFLNVWLTPSDAADFARVIRIVEPQSPPVRIDKRGIFWPEPSEEEGLQSDPLCNHPEIGPSYSFAGGAGCFSEAANETENE